MIYHLLDADTTASRCLDLIARHAPRLMRIGGGSLPQEKPPCTDEHRMTPERIQAALALVGQGLSATQIAERVGSTQSAVRKAMVRRGIKLRDGRAGKVWKIRRVEA
jgi:DNA-binding NarL/FixJ family response regulator